MIDWKLTRDISEIFSTEAAVENPSALPTTPTASVEQLLTEILAVRGKRLHWVGVTGIVIWVAFALGALGGVVLRVR